MIRVLEAISDTNIGGAGILLATRCKYMDPCQYDITVAMPRESALTKRMRQVGVSVIEIDGCYDRSLDWRSVPEWVAVLKRVRPVIVNCHGCLSCRIAARICRIPVLIDTRHCAFELKPWMTHFPGKYVIGALLQACSDRTIAVAYAAKKNLVDMGANPKKIRVIINGAEGIERISVSERQRIRREYSIPESACVVGIFARLEECKDHRTFLRAARILLSQDSRYHFLIVGDGSKKRELQRYAAQLGIARFVQFVGFVSDVTPYMNVTDIQVNCSVGTETSSLALSEGMSLGIPSVVSDFGGNPYMVQEGVNGFLFPMGKAGLLANKIRHIQQDPVLYQRLSMGAEHRFLTELNAQRMAAQTAEYYMATLKALNHKLLV